MIPSGGITEEGILLDNIFANLAAPKIHDNKNQQGMDA
jgi:hypothetical protein